jgi:hypothetical protein
MDKIKVIGFAHWCMVNDYMDIIKEQINLILRSGLYSRVDKIYIGCLGEKSAYNRLKSFISPHPKFEIYSYDIDIKKYEFHTLKIVHEVSLENEKFYGFYIHTKGVNYPGNQGGKYWLDYMNYYNLTKWRDAVKHLDVGYYTYGVKLLPSSYPPAFKMHYSGNFWWFNSDYVATLPPIDSMDKCNRYNAETWICLEQPIAATACQDFVDYNVTGFFTPPNIKDNE